MFFLMRVILKAVLILVAVNVLNAFMTKGSFEQPVSVFEITGIRERMDDTRWFLQSMAGATQERLRQGFDSSDE